MTVDPQEATTARTPRPEPAGDVLLRTRARDTGDVVVWQPRGNCVWWDRLGRWSATWPELDAEQYGPVELLVPIAYRTPAPGEPAHIVSQQAVEAILNPVGTMLAELAAAAGAGITAVVADAYRRGAEQVVTCG